MISRILQKTSRFSSIACGKEDIIVWIKNGMGLQKMWFPRSTSVLH